MHAYAYAERMLTVEAGFIFQLAILCIHAKTYVQSCFML